MGKRLDLHAKLVAILGTRNVYFQPPANVNMVYPCIVYNRNKVITKFAGNLPYGQTKGYQLTVIDEDPDSVTPDKIAQLPSCVFDRHFTTTNLNHDIYNIYF